MTLVSPCSLRRLVPLVRRLSPFTFQTITVRSNKQTAAASLSQARRIHSKRAGWTFLSAVVTRSAEALFLLCLRLSLSLLLSPVSPLCESPAWRGGANLGGRLFANHDAQILLILLFSTSDYGLRSPPGSIWR